MMKEVVECLVPLAELSQRHEWSTLHYFRNRILACSLIFIFLVRVSILKLRLETMNEITVFDALFIFDCGAGHPYFLQLRRQGFH